MQRPLYSLVVLIVATFGLLIALNIVASADSPDPEPRIVQPEQCFGAHGWVAPDSSSYSVADASCPEDLRP